MRNTLDSATRKNTQLSNLKIMHRSTVFWGLIWLRQCYTHEPYWTSWAWTEWWMKEAQKNKRAHRVIKPALTIIVFSCIIHLSLCSHFTSASAQEYWMCNNTKLYFSKGLNWHLYDVVITKYLATFMLISL